MVGAPASCSVGLTFDSLLKNILEVLTAVHISTAILRHMTLFSLVADYYCLQEPLFSGRKLE